MSSTDNSENRIRFLLALMTRDYEGAISIGQSMQKHGARDWNVLQAISMLEAIQARTQAKSGPGATSESDSSDNDDNEANQSEIAIPCRPDKPFSSVSDRVRKRLAQADMEFSDKMYRLITLRVNTSPLRNTR